jgi:ribose transport system ATP-binding protein
MDSLEPALSLEMISKTFGATQALRGASLSVAHGEIHGLVGLNGSGKSTIIKILSGVLIPEPGARCHLWGSEIAFPIHFASSLGIAVVQQDLALNKELSVIDNMNVAGAVAPLRSLLSPVIRRNEIDKVNVLLSSLGWELPLKAKVADLEAGEQALVSIVRALSLARQQGNDRCLLILDEPTAYLTDADSERLFGAVKQLVARGSSAILVSHRLDDILQTCGRVTVLRDGEVVGVQETAQSTKSSLTSLMTGQTVVKQGSGDREVNQRTAPKSSRLRIDGVRTERLHGVTLSVDDGEILGCTGLRGTGFEELPYMIAGLIPHRGEIAVEDRAIGRNATQAANAGVAIVPEDRLGQALWSLGTVAENLDAGRRSGRFGKFFVRKSAVEGKSKELMTTYSVVAHGPRAFIKELSGGNQQKVVLARALRRKDVKLLVLQEATQGVDVEARRVLYGAVKERTRTSGLGVLICSTDLEELASMCDRVLVFSSGRITDELVGGDVTVDRIALACQMRLIPTTTQLQDGTSNSTIRDEGNAEGRST